MSWLGRFLVVLLVAAGVVAALVGAPVVLLVVFVAVVLASVALWPVAGRAVARDAERRGVDPEIARSAVIWFGALGWLWWLANRNHFAARAERGSST